MPDTITRLNAALEGRYAIERELGEGGMATVYLADDLKHERKVAVKVLKPELAAVVGAERFLAEIKTTANLTHPHILPLFDSDESDTFLFYVMPYVEGETLRGRLDREHQLPVDDAVQIAKNVAEALDYAHRHGVIHRDIKPANILLQDGKPVISDFGIALAVSAGGAGRLTETGLSLGTPHYMSPEQATGDLSVGAATDVYALGCVLYEMLVAEPPYTGGTPQAILGKIVMGDADPVTKHRKSVPPNVDAAIRKALEKVPADRFAGAADLAKALGDPGFRHGDRVSLGTRVIPSMWNPLSVALAAVFILGTGMGWLLLQTESPGQVSRLEISLPSGSDALGGIGVSPDGQSVAFSVVSDLGRQIWLRPLDRLSAVSLPDTEDGVDPAFSPAGDRIAFFRPEPDGQLGSIMIASLERGGSPEMLVRGVWGCPCAWAPNDMIYYTNENYGISRVSAGGGSPETLTTRAEGEVSHHQPDPLPEGRGVLFQRSTGSSFGDVTLLAMATGEVRVLFPGTSPRFVDSGHIVYRTRDGLMAVAFEPRRMEVSGAPRQVVEGALFDQLAISETGTLVYVPADGRDPAQERLVLVNRNGQERPLGFEPQDYGFPRFSPEGDRLGVLIDRALWVLDLERGSRSRVAFGGGTNMYPTWTRDGRRLAHADANVGDNTLFLTSADGSGQDTLLVRDGLQFATSWSPDGHLVFQERDFSGSAGDRDLWVLEPGIEPEPVVLSPFADRDGAFSPDGRWLAYRSNRTGTFEVYVRQYPGPGSEVQISAGGGSGPVWSRDGSEIFYRTEDRMMAVSVVVDAEGDLRPEPPRALFEDPYVRRGEGNAQNFDVSPEGDFVMIAGGEPARRLVLVGNFRGELRRLAPTN